MKILIISNVMPYPPISGGALRLYNLLRRVSAQHQVWLASHLHSPEQTDSIGHLEQFCEGVLTAPLRRRHPLGHIPGLLSYALRRKPLELKFLHSKELADKIRRLTSEVDMDIVQIEESRLALYLDLFPSDCQNKKILTFYDIAFDQAGRFASIEQSFVMKWRSWLYGQTMRRWEPHYAERFDRCVTVSERDRDLLTDRNPRLHVEVIPNGVDTKRYQILPLPDSSPPVLLYVGGMSYPPSRDAVLFFGEEILPRVWDICPEAEFWVVGADPPSRLNQLDGDRVHAMGIVEDVRPYYQRCTACVVPLRAGGGTRLKILEAMALGRPVVSTTLGCEGLEVIPKKHVEALPALPTSA